jgi:hypothetical protein
MTLFEKALVMHLIGDWLLQNDWMARCKSALRHPAAWVHAGIHTLLLSLVLGWIGGVVLGLVHMLVDTRVPQRWWSRAFSQTQSGEMATHVMIWGDQVIHISTIALWLVAAPHLFR